VSGMTRGCAVVAAGALALLTTGCASAEQPEVEQVATAFENPSGDAQARCALLAPTALAQLESRSGAPCEEAIADLPLKGGDVGRVQVWGRDAQVRLGGDTVFLTKTSTGWRVAAAACSARPVGPYDCEVETA
jgi:hypothetical protein